MDDALLNCATGVCCPPEAQAIALGDALVSAGVCNEIDEARAIAGWFVKHFDFAPAGTLKPLVKAIVKLHKAT